MFNVLFRFLCYRGTKPVALSCQQVPTCKYETGKTVNEANKVFIAVDDVVIKACQPVFSTLTPQGDTITALFTL